jgi:hypothetical protein
VRHSDDDGPDLGVAVTQLTRRDTTTTGPLPVPLHSGASEQGGS